MDSGRSRWSGSIVEGLAIACSPFPGFVIAMPTPILQIKRIVLFLISPFIALAYMAGIALGRLAWSAGWLDCTWPTELWFLPFA